MTTRPSQGRQRRKDRDECTRKALQKAAKQKGQATDPMEANKVRVDRAKRQKAKAPYLQPLVLTMRQQAIAYATI